MLRVLCVHEFISIIEAQDFVNLESYVLCNLINSQIICFDSRFFCPFNYILSLPFSWFYGLRADCLFWSEELSLLKGFRVICLHDSNSIIDSQGLSILSYVFVLFYNFWLFVLISAFLFIHLKFCPFWIFLFCGPRVHCPILSDKLSMSVGTVICFLFDYLGLMNPKYIV